MSDLISEISQELQALGRTRRQRLKVRTSVENSVRILVANYLGYSPALPEAERIKFLNKAEKLIKEICKAEKYDHELAKFIKSQHAATRELDLTINEVQRKMTGFLEQFTRMVDWINHPDQKGIAITGLAYLIGETGDLRNYSTVSKVWKRMGLSPYEWNAKVYAGSTLRKKHKIPAEVWEKFGYSPRRCSVAFLMADAMCKQGKKDGPYLQKYRARRKQLEERGVEVKGHLHKDALRIMVKELIKRIWIVWNNYPKHPQRDWMAQKSE